MKKIKKILINILVMPIRNREKRHKLRRYILDFHIVDTFQVKRFLYSPVFKNSILLLESNNYHGEVIAGYMQYFQKLGFNVDCLISSEINKWHPFCRLDLKNIKLFHCDYVALGWILKSKKILKYKHVFVMSSAYYRKTADENYTGILDEFPHLKEHPSLFVVEHDLVDIKRFKEEGLIQKNHLITLGHFDKGVFMSPILFGNVLKNPKSFRKNHQALIQAIEKLASENMKFKVIVVGRGTLDNLPKSIHPYIQIMGRLDFPKMFDCMEKSDFFLPLLDADNPEHNRYITTGVTGSAQLIYGFSKVPILHPKFAPFYGFNEKNALLTADLAKGMRQAIQMPADEYKQMQSNLTNLAEKLENESFHNLKEILK